MMLCDLPGDILAIVLRRCLQRSYNAADDLKRNLPLLAVCRLWRRAAIPLVHKLVFIRHGCEPDRRYPYSHDYNVEEPTDVAVMTNLDLVAMAGCVRAVKRVDIDVYCLANPIPGWREVIQRMRSAASVWRVVELEVTMHPGGYHYDRRNVDMAKYTAVIAQVGDALAALMPDVYRLKCYVAHQNPVAQLLYGRLAAHYTDQLQLLHSGNQITVPPGSRFTRLKKISIYGDGGPGYRLPRMASGELVKMHVYGVLANHSWAPFSNDSNSQVIEFTKLKSLSMGYGRSKLREEDAVRDRDGHPWTLRFPSLNDLSISCQHHVCPLLEYAVLPPYVESIFIKMSPTAYLNYASLVLPATKRLSILVAWGPRDGPSVLPVINRLLESAHGSEALKLTVEHCDQPVTPETLTCTALTHLEVMAPTSADNMLAFIERLPRLVELMLHFLDLSDIQADLSIPEADEDTVVEPLSLSLARLDIDCAGGRHCRDRAVAVAKYVLLRIPTLTTLSVKTVHGSQVVSFVEAYVPRYPHLTRVRLDIEERKPPVFTNGGYPLPVPGR